MCTGSQRVGVVENLVKISNILSVLRQATFTAAFRLSILFYPRSRQCPLLPQELTVSSLTSGADSVLSYLRGRQCPLLPQEPTVSSLTSGADSVLFYPRSRQCPLLPQEPSVSSFTPGADTYSVLFYPWS